jgi:hypothetical protein
MADLMFDIQKDIEAGILSFADIATKHNVPFNWVDEVALEMMNYPQDSYDDSMDGDAGSALASAGWGTDEDYGYTGDYDDRY